MSLSLPIWFERDRLALLGGGWRRGWFKTDERRNRCSQVHFLQIAVHLGKILGIDWEGIGKELGENWEGIGITAVPNGLGFGASKFVAPSRVLGVELSWRHTRTWPQVGGTPPISSRQKGRNLKITFLQKYCSFGQFHVVVCENTVHLGSF